MMKKLMAATALGIAALAAGCAKPLAQLNLGDPNVSGNVLAEQVCSYCHGNMGNSVDAQFPRLAGQQPQYITEQLKAFRVQGRSDIKGKQYMWEIALNLTDNQIAELADYYHAQKAIPDAPGNVALTAEGDRIFHEGVPTTGVPACMTCHGAEGHGHDGFPRIASQHADYLIKQLWVIKSTDTRPQAAVMKPVAHGLNEEQIRAVATYLSSKS